MACSPLTIARRLSEEKALHHLLTRRALIIGSLSIVNLAHAEPAKVWRVAIVTSGVGQFTRTDAIGDAVMIASGV